MHRPTNRRHKIHRKTRAISLIAVLFGIGIAFNSWAADWQDLSDGLRFLSTATPEEAVVYLVEVDPSKLRLELLTPRDRESGRLPLRQLIAGRGVVAAVNASFFAEDGRAMGLVIVDGHALNPLRQTNWGIFQIIAGQPSIIHSRDYRADPQRSLAVQTGPRLVIAGQVPNFKDTAIAPRSAVCLTPEQRVILAATPGLITLEQWAQTLKPYCVNALNLDGGSSTQFYVKAKDLYLPGGAPIPNALAVFAK